MLKGGKARGVCVVLLRRTYHWLKSMGCEDIQHEKGEMGAIVPHMDL